MACSTYWGEMYRVFFGGGVKPEVNGKLGISRRRWENNIKMDVQIPVECGL